MRSRRIGTLFLFFALFFTYFLAVESYWKVKLQGTENKTVLLTNELPALLAETLEEEETKQDRPKPFVLWKELQDQNVVSKDGISALASVLLFQGKADLLFSGNTLLSGEDRDGCLISGKLAYELFGSTKVTGKEVNYGERRVVIRSVLERNTSLLILLGDREDTWTYLTLADETSLSEFLMRHSLSGQRLRMELLGDLGQIFLVIPPITAAMIVLAGSQNNQDAGRGQRFFRLASQAFLLFLLFFVLQKVLYLPGTMVPNKWSDFTFWSDWWETVRKDFLFLLMAPKSTGQASCILEFCSCAGYSFLGQMFCILGFGRLNR